MNWKIGQKTVCIKNLKPRPGEEDIIVPMIGEIYTIRDVTTDGRLTGLLLVEVTNRIRRYQDGLFEPAFDSDAFRPIVDIGDEVEEYIKSKITEPEYA